MRSQTQRQMAIFLPFISLIYGSILPAGLFLYWIVSTIFSIVQQYLIIGWGGMFPIFGWTPGFAVGPHAALPGRRAHGADLLPRARRERPRDQPPSGRPSTGPLGGGHDPPARPAGSTWETTLKMKAEMR